MRNIKINHLANFAWFMPVSLEDTICSLFSLLSGSWKWHRVPGGHTNSNKEHKEHDSVNTRWNINWALWLHSVGSEYIPYAHIGLMDHRKTLILLMSHLNCNFPRRWLACYSFRQNSVSYNGSNCYPTDIFNNGSLIKRKSVAGSLKDCDPLSYSTLTNRRSHSPHCRGIRLRF